MIEISKETQKKIMHTVKRIGTLLIDKNIQYGDSVMDPIAIFAQGNPQDLVRVRIDDKLSRLKRGNDSIESDIDIVDDLIGYLVLLRIMMGEEK